MIHMGQVRQSGKLSSLLLVVLTALVVLTVPVVLVVLVVLTVLVL